MCIFVQEEQSEYFQIKRTVLNNQEHIRQFSMRNEGSMFIKISPAIVCSDNFLFFFKIE